MKASKLIEELKLLIASHGDLEVEIFDDEGVIPVAGLALNTDEDETKPPIGFVVCDREHIDMLRED